MERLLTDLATNIPPRKANTLSSQRQSTRSVAAIQLPWPSRCAALSPRNTWVTTIAMMAIPRATSMLASRWISVACRGPVRASGQCSALHWPMGVTRLTGSCRSLRGGDSKAGTQLLRLLRCKPTMHRFFERTYRLISKKVGTKP